MILDSKDFLNVFKEKISRASSSFLACSAFIKSSALQQDFFQSNLGNKEVKIIARWQKRDLLAKASDLDVYHICKEMGWQFGISQNLHAKIYLFDERDILLGSANLTQNGFNLNGSGNFEYGTSFICSPEDIKKINRFIASETVWMNDGLFNSMAKELDEFPVNSYFNDASWSPKIQSLLYTPVRFLLLSELLHNSPVDLLTANLDEDTVRSDMRLLAVDLDGLTSENLRRCFRTLRLCTWLKYELKKNNGQLTFGALSSVLHDSILNEPRPYRVDIKQYVSTIFSWAALDTETFRISRPRHTQVLTLNQ